METDVGPALGVADYLASTSQACVAFASPHPPPCQGSAGSAGRFVPVWDALASTMGQLWIRPGSMRLTFAGSALGSCWGITSVLPHYSPKPVTLTVLCSP